MVKNRQVSLSYLEQFWMNRLGRRRMKFMRSMIPALALGVIVLMTGCSKDDPNVLASVGEKTITMQDLREEMIRVYRSESSAARKSLEQREESLNTLVERKLKVEGARAEGYFDTPEVKEKRERYLADGMMNRLHKIEVLDKVATDEKLSELYDKQGLEVEASHILLRWTTDSSAVRRQAEEVAREVSRGMPFAQAAERYTEEPGGGERQGSLGWFTWGRMVPEFQDACWAMEVGEVSKPVETQFGVHLIHLTGRREVGSRPSFEEQRESLADSYLRMNSEEVSRLGLEYVTALKEELGFFMDSMACADLLTAIQAKIRPEHKLRDILAEDLRADWAGKALARWDGGSVTVVELAASTERNFMQASEITTRERVVDMVNFSALFPMIESRAREKGLDKDPEINRAADDQVEGGVLMDYERDRIKGKANISEEAIADWYNSHPDDYMHPKTVRVQEIYVKDKALADELAAKAKAGEDFGALAKKHTERPGKQGTDGTLEPFQSGRYGKMGEAAFAMNVGDVSEPLPIGRNWSVIKLVEQIPPKPKTLDESRTSIRMKLEREARKENTAVWRTEIEKVVPVKIHADRLNRLFADEAE
jgi:parvulin-like peptidyl-prolyl isomerase